MNKKTGIFLGAVLMISSLVLVSCVSNQAEQEQQKQLEQIGIETCEIPLTSTPIKISKPEGTAFFLPAPPEYPYPKTASERAQLKIYAQCLSDRLTDYINAWMEGRAPAQIPNTLIPWVTNLNEYTTFTLVDPDQIKAEEQWGIRPASPINETGLFGGFPDPNATYLLNPALLAPFNTTLIIEGQFPHSRFFDIQVTPPFDLNVYRNDGGIGVGEVPIVDADIEPEPGHTNPFRVGANRMATKRDYRVIYKMVMGDPVDLNPAFRQPDFRATGNTRYGSGILYQGPWGHPKSDGHGRGLFDPGSIWIRYYAPDHGQGSLGGVPLPKMSFELEDGRRFFILADFKPYLERVQEPIPIVGSDYGNPADKPLQGPDHGWFKQAGIFEALMGGIAVGTDFAETPYVNALVEGVGGRGDLITPPGNYEQSATSATYIDYMVRSIALEKDHVVVMTGRLPTFPDTRDGASQMTGAELRYWSLTGFHVPQGFEVLDALYGKVPAGLAVNSVMDDEVVLDSERNFVIVYSRDEERPNNANAEAGVTWVDWGPSAEVSWTFRWMSVAPEWKAPFAPSVDHIGSRGDYWSIEYDPDVISRNNHEGELGHYLPRIHYMSRAEFEALGSDIRAEDVPVWK